MPDFAEFHLVNVKVSYTLYKVFTKKSYSGGNFFSNKENVCLSTDVIGR